MRRWQHTTIAIMILGTLLFCSTSSNATSINAYQDVFIEHLEMGPATYLNLNVHGRVTAEIDKSLTELYHNNKLQPFWIEDGKPDQRAADIVSVLKEAESHGLNPDSYFVDRIDQYWGSKDTAGLVRLHLLSQGTELQRTTRSNYSSYQLIGGCNYNV